MAPKLRQSNAGAIDNATAIELMAALADLEQKREQLHTALREARGCIAGARLDLRATYGDVSFEQVPGEELTAIRPRIVCVARPPTVQVIVLEEADLAIGNSDSKEAETVVDPTAAFDESLGRADPLLWFTRSPPHELRDAQRRFRDAAILSADVVAAQRRVEMLLA